MDTLFSHCCPIDGSTGDESNRQARSHSKSEASSSVPPIIGVTMSPHPAPIPMPAPIAFDRCVSSDIWRSGRTGPPGDSPRVRQSVGLGSEVLKEPIAEENHEERSEEIKEEVDNGITGTVWDEYRVEPETVRECVDSVL